MSSIAQTNLQLYEQLRGAGWGAEELGRQRAAYNLASTLSSGQMRASGKSALAHLVGTASIVAMHTDRRPPVLAALLHAAYTLGDFGDGRRGVSARKRAAVCRTLGQEAEQIVFRYTQLGWHAERVEDVSARADTLDQLDRDVALVRLANELEDHSDLGMRYRGYTVDEIRNDRSLDEMVGLASRLGFRALSSALAEVIAIELDAEIPAGLIEDRHSQYLVLSPSYGVRTAVRLRRLARRARRGLSAVLAPALRRGR